MREDAHVDSGAGRAEQSGLRQRDRRRGTSIGHGKIEARRILDRDEVEEKLLMTPGNIAMLVS